MSTPSTLYPKKVDLTNCDKEPIHLLGKIQSHGYVLGFDRESLKLTHYSENSVALIQKTDTTIKEIRLYDIFDATITKRILDLLITQKKQPLSAPLAEEEFIVISHLSGSTILLDIEPVGEALNAIEHQEKLSNAITELSTASDELDMCARTSKLIKEYYGYDRVMIYQFDADWNGQIIAETKEVHLESWLGLNYPASDIPQQARKLFLQQGARIIADARAQPATLCALHTDHTQTVDLSLSELRAVSPIHIEYLANMKVEATLTVSIIYKGTLWGLIACHHYSPKFISYHHRLACKFITQVFANQLGLLTANSVLEKINNSGEIRSKLLQQMSENWNITQGLSTGAHTILDMNESTGAVIAMDSELKLLGNTPPKEALQGLIDFVCEQDHEEYYIADCISESYPPFVDFIEIASGVLALYISKKEKNVLLWFKPEILQTIDWAGDPNKSVTQEDQRLTPRKSFAKWSETQKGHSNPWLDYEIASAKALKEHIAEIIVQKYEEVKILNEKLENAYNELESFSYSVSHDLRAPLRGIDGFAQILEEDYHDVLDDYGRQAVSTIVASIDKMNLLIDDILAFSGLGKTIAIKTNFSMNALVDEVLQHLKSDTVFENTNVQIQDLSESYGDRTMLFQLWSNLIDNALKYSSKSDAPEITIGFENETWYVQDNGIGFDQHYESSIFGIFNRLLSDDYPGSGIGLAIAKRVIEKHHGKIWTKSKLNEGTTFYFQLNKKKQ